MKVRLVALVPLAVALLASRPVRAEDAAAATHHFDAGNALYKASRFAEAEVEFQAAWDARHAYDIAANLGDCEVEVRQFREASEHLAYALKELPISVKEGVRERLQARFNVARAEVAAIRVQVSPAQASLSVNGRAYASVPELIFLEPGPATVEATMPGYTKAVVVTPPLDKGGTRDVALTLTTAQKVDEGSSSKSVPLVVAGVGLTVAGLAAGLALTLAGGSKASSADAMLAKIEAAHPGDASPCAATPPDARCATLKSANASSDSLHNAGTAAFVVGGVFAAATLTYVLWPTRKPAEAPAALRVTPVLAPGYGGALLRTSF